MFGRNITTTLSPLPPNKRKWKYSLKEGNAEPGHGPAHDENDEEEDEDDGDRQEHFDPKAEVKLPPKPVKPVASLDATAAQPPAPSAPPSA
jgi:hypothetical protein